MNITKYISILSVHTVSPEYTEFVIPEILSLIGMHKITPKYNELFTLEPKCKDFTNSYDLKTTSFEHLPFIRYRFPVYDNFPGIIPKDSELNKSLNEVCNRAVLT